MLQVRVLPRAPFDIAIDIQPPAKAHQPIDTIIIADEQDIRARASDLHSFDLPFCRTYESCQIAAETDIVLDNIENAMTHLPLSLVLRKGNDVLTTRTILALISDVHDNNLVGYIECASDGKCSVKLEGPWQPKASFINRNLAEERPFLPCGTTLSPTSAPSDTLPAIARSIQLLTYRRLIVRILEKSDTASSDDIS